MQEVQIMSRACNLSSLVEVDERGEEVDHEEAGDWGCGSTNLSV